MTISMENCYFSSDTEQDKIEWQSVWRVRILVLTHDKAKLNDNQYGDYYITTEWTTELLNEWETVWRITILVLTYLDKIYVEMNGNQYGGLTPVWCITISVLRTTTSILTLGKMQMTITLEDYKWKYVPTLDKIQNQWQSVRTIFH